jgi:hypothetical protein
MDNRADVGGGLQGHGGKKSDEVDNTTSVGSNGGNSENKHGLKGETEVKKESKLKLFVGKLGLDMGTVMMMFKCVLSFPPKLGSLHQFDSSACVTFNQS